MRCENCGEVYDHTSCRWRCPHCGWKAHCCEGAPQSGNVSEALSNLLRYSAKSYDQ